MNLPNEILDKIIEISDNMSKNEISKDFRNISDKYIGDKKGQSLLNKSNEAIAYAIARMPATYVATMTAFKQILTKNKLKENLNLNEFETVIDVGAGTGSATLAICEMFTPKKVICLEKEDVMIELGSKLLSESENKVVKNVDWKKFDIMDASKINFCQKKADVVVTSYMLNEFGDGDVLKVVDSLWQMTEKLLVIIDPGTPKDYERLIKIKEFLENNGGFIIAPCTTCEKCGLPETDWCNFSCRVERTKLQKDVKLGTVPYEDEKFTYLAVSKIKYDEKNEKIARIIRHPLIKSNMVEVKLCLEGKIYNKIYTKKDKEIYKLVRKAKVGDVINVDE